MNSIKKRKVSASRFGSPKSKKSFRGLKRIPTINSSKDQKTSGTHSRFQLPGSSVFRSNLNTQRSVIKSSIRHAHFGKHKSNPNLKKGKRKKKRKRRKKNDVFERLHSALPERKKKLIEEKSEGKGGFLKQLEADYKILQLNNKINDKNSRKFRMHQFIHEKKKKNLTKYGDHSKLNYYAIPVPKGTISIMMNTKKKNSLFTVKSTKRPILEKSKFKVKWKTIQWLCCNKLESIGYMRKNGRKIFKKYCKEKPYCNTTKEEFLEIMCAVGLGVDHQPEKSYLKYKGFNFIRQLKEKEDKEEKDHLIGKKLFSVLSNYRTKKTDFRDLLVAIEIFRENDTSEKLVNFLDLCDMDNTGLVEEKIVYNVLKGLCLNVDESFRLKRFIREVVNELESTISWKFKKTEFLQGYREHIQLYNLVGESIKNIRKVDKLIENDIEQNFKTWIPLTNAIVRYKEGILYPEIDQMMGLVKKNERLTFKMRERKKMHLKEIKQNNANRFEDLSDDFDDFETT